MRSHLRGVQGDTSDPSDVETGHLRLAMKRAMSRATMMDDGLQRFNPLAWMVQGGLRDWGCRGA